MDPQTAKEWEKIKADLYQRIREERARQIPAQADPEFEAYVLGLSGVQSLEILENEFLVTVQRSDERVVARRIRLWMKTYSRNYGVSCRSVDNIAPSTYDPVERGVTRWDYVPKDLGF